MSDHEKERHEHPGFEEFEESAKKFKLGPVAPPEPESHRRDIGGDVPSGKRTLPAAERMPDGEPGVFKRMPGEDEE